MIGEHELAARNDRGAPAGIPAEQCRRRLIEIGREVPQLDTAPLLAILDDGARDAEEKRDALSTRLMEVFRVHQSRGAFGLLYELNRQHLYMHVASRLRRYQSKADANDVLQEVFVNVYRYPHRFDSARDDAFRVWTATIVRNTVLKHLRSLSRSGRAEVPFEDLPEQPQPPGDEPLRGVIQSESQAECNRVYVTYLHFYLSFYRMLSEREQRAIHLVEVEARSYRDAARELGIKLENLKMVVFRARRKIHRSMRRVFEGLPPDVRPARDPSGGVRPARDPSGGVRPARDPSAGARSARDTRAAGGAGPEPGESDRAKAGER